MKKMIRAIGKYSDPEDTTKPYFVQIEFFKDKPVVEQPVSESQLLELFNSLIRRNDLSIDIEVK